MSWYNPKHKRIVWKKGEYAAVLKDAEEQESKTSGVPMYKLTVTVYDGDREMLLNDYLVSGEKNTWKIHQFAKAIGQQDQFDSGDFRPDNFIGDGFRVALDIETTDQYGDQNRITKYIQKGGGDKSPIPVKTKTSPDVKPLTDEDIPF